MMDYDLMILKNEKRNQKFLNEFTKWLEKQDLVKKTINKHVSNVNLYINSYLIWHDIIKMEDGVYEIDYFFRYWYVEKRMFSTANSLKEMFGSLKKFYKCMNELNYISDENYKQVCDIIKENKDEYIDYMEEYNDFDELDFDLYQLQISTLVWSVLFCNLLIKLLLRLMILFVLCYNIIVFKLMGVGEYERT